MTHPVPRRRLLELLMALPAWPSLVDAQQRRPDYTSALADLEQASGGRLGVSVLDVATGRRLQHRADERFAMCSTFKLLAAALVLARVDRGEERLDRRVVFSKADLVTYSPGTESHVGEPGMTMEALCADAITMSDNTAGNLLLASFGGPAGLTAWVRSLGDSVTRLDRIEVALNEATPGDPRDTTSPAAMTETVRTIVTGRVLSPASRETLIDWLVASTTGATRLREGFPRGWRVGNKTGSGNHGVTNDVAVAWPSPDAPIIVSAYFAESTLPTDQRNAVLADVGRIVGRWVGAR